MMTVRRLAKPVAALAIPAALLWAFFGQVFTGRVFYAGDIARIYLPQRVALTDALRSQRIPWWSSGLGIGYPLLAEGEVGALYPLNWIICLFLSPEIGLTVSVILHYALTALGLYLFGRSLGMSAGGGLLSAVIWAFGGFNISHASHVSILCTATWLPWMLLLVERLLRLEQRRNWHVVALAACVAMQFFAGHAQMSLLNMMAVAAYALDRWWTAGRKGSARGGLPLIVLGVVLGGVLSLPQLLPSYQLSSLSQRAGGLDPTFFTSYSFHPLLGVTWLSPFVLGNPYPEGSIELMVYSGLLPLLLASLAIKRHGDRQKWFWLTLGVLGYLLALGRWNPVYALLRRVPVLSLFRVPARYLYWESLSLAVLAGLGLDVLLGTTRRRSARAGLALGAFAVLLAVGVCLAASSASHTEQLIERWRWFPALLLLAGSAVLLAAKWLDRATLAGLALIVLAGDLQAYGQVLSATYSATMPREQVIEPLNSRPFLQLDPSMFRVYTKESIVPALSVMRESYYPNMGLTYGVASANLYLPLVPPAYQSYLTELSAERLNRLNAKYYLIPQLLPVDEARELYDVENPLAALPANEWLAIDAQEIVALEVESYLSHSVDLGDGTLAATLRFRTADKDVTIPLRAGLETAEWAYEREDVRRAIAHSLPEVATTWPARSGFPPGEHVGHTYLARYEFAEPQHFTAVRLEPQLPLAFVRVERVRFMSADGCPTLLSRHLRLGDHSIVYRSEDVLIYRNEDVLPRAYTLPATEVEYHDGNVILPEMVDRSQIGAAELVSYDDLQVRLRAHLSEPGYLILADLYYPGWRARVDGQAAAILCADTVFRAVRLEPGEHLVSFTYRFAP